MNISLIADELSTGSSPRLRHTARGGSSTGGSGAGSPRPRDTGEARLRPGVTGCRAAGHNRHSATLSSTLQQDLIRLISPDYASESEAVLSKVRIMSSSKAGRDIFIHLFIPLIFFNALGR